MTIFNNTNFIWIICIECW